MKQKSALIITAFYNYDQNVRINHLESVLKNKGYSVFILSSNFDHRKKIEYTNQKDNLTLLSVPFYKRNMSVSRLYSHYVFSKKMYAKCTELKPDLIYAITPPNFMNLYLTKYKNLHKEVELITEIEDLWPESIPVSNTLKTIATPVFSIWSSIRNKNLAKSDVVVFECELFRDFLKKYINKNALVHLCKKDIDHKINIQPIPNEKHYLYLGSVNNLLDIDFLCSFIKKSNSKQPSVLHIIGGGENMDDLKQKCEEYQISFIEHGIIYDDIEKGKIISNCDYALNVMKPTVFVGITMKSVDYFCYGLPLINTIQGDTSAIVDTYQCGFNVNMDNMDEQIEKIVSLSTKEWQAQSVQSRKVYEELFSYEAVEKELNTILK